MKEDREENIVGKGENAGNQHFLHFQQCILLNHGNILSFRPPLSSTNLFNLLPNNKILDQSNLKDSADDKKKCDQKIKLVFGKNRKHCGKGENAGYQHFLLVLQCFQKSSFPGSLKVTIVNLNKTSILSFCKELQILWTHNSS